MRRLLPLALLCLPLMHSARAGDEPKDDPQALQGTWKAVGVTFFGEKQANEDLSDAVMVFDGNKFLQKTGQNVDKKGTFRVDAGQKPMAIDLIAEGGEKMLGIYRLQGKTLTICAAPPTRTGAGKRPDEFSSTKENGQLLMILQRTKK